MNQVGSVVGRVPTASWDLPSNWFRPLHDPAPAVVWYATAAAWWVPMERDARHELGPKLTWHLDLGHLLYRARDVRIDGDPEAHDVEFHFYADPPYETWGLPAEEYPRVFGDRSRLSPHRMPDDDALCLWHPHDTAERRWMPSDGLLALIEHACRHLFAEAWWRTTGTWLLEQAPHGLGLNAHDV